MSDDALAAAFADCEALVVALLVQMADREDERNGVNRIGNALRSAALCVSLGQHRSAETNEAAVLSAHRTAVNRAQARAGGVAAAAKRWGPKGEKS